MVTYKVRKQHIAMLQLIFFLSVSFATHAQENVLWEFHTEGRIYSTPLIDGNRIFVGSGDHRFYALDKHSGESVWEFKTGGAVHSSPTLINDLICFGSADGNLYAVDKMDGKLVWKFESEGEKMYDLWDYYLSSPAVDDETVYWGCGDGNVYALQGSDGQLKWTFQTGDVVHASPVVHENHVYIGGFDGFFYCLNKEDGNLVWKFNTVGARYFPKGEIQRAALVEDDVVYFGSRDYNMYALDSKTGRGWWNMKQPRGWIIATPLEHNGNIYFGTSDAHIFYSMDKVSGTINWTIPLNMRVYGKAVLYNDLIYFGTFDGKVLGIDAVSGEIEWEFQTESSRRNYNTMYDENGHFKEGFELYGSGYVESERMIHALGSILCDPVIENQTIYFGSSDGNIYAVKLN